MDKINQKTIFLSVLIGAGLWFVTWNVTSINKQQVKYEVLQKHIQEVNENLLVLNNSLQTLNSDIQQLHLDISGYKTDKINNQLPEQAFDQVSNSDIDTSHLIPDDSFSDNNPIPVAIDMPTAQEMESVNLIVEKIRARDTNAYADFPSLLSSNEMVNLGPAAMDKIMAELAKMYENGEIDPSFFPNRD